MEEGALEAVLERVGSVLLVRPSHPPTHPPTHLSI